MQEYVSKVTRISTLGISSAPAESLPLDMDDAALDLDRWPDPAQILHLLGISIDCGGHGFNPTRLEPVIDVYQPSRSFGYIELSMNEFMRLCIHDGIDPRAMLQERAITDQPRHAIDAAEHRRRPIEPILDVTPQRGATQTTDLRQLAHAVAFNDPLCEPEVSMSRRMMPHKCAMTLQAVPTLMQSTRLTKAFRSAGSTANADLFWSPQSTRWILFPRTLFQRTTYSKISNTF
jgi:hypothetical protein